MQAKEDGLHQVSKVGRDEKQSSSGYTLKAEQQDLVCGMREREKARII